MTWDLRDDAVRTWIIEGVAPPATVDALFGDDNWAGVFSMWATDLGYTGGDYTASSLYSLWVDYRGGVGYEGIRDKYVAEGNQYGIAWPPALTDRVARTDAAMDEPDSTLAEIWNIAREQLEPYTEAFQADIYEIQLNTASQPQAVAFSRDSIDQDMVDRVNAANVKALEEEGEYVQGWLRNDLLLLGDGHPDSYVRYAQAEGVQVRIFMWEKGGKLSRGELRYDLIADRPVPWDETAGIEAAVGRFSKKKLRHR